MQNIEFQKVANSSYAQASVTPISRQGLFVQNEYFILYSSICVAYIVLDMVANMEVNMVAYMEVDMVLLRLNFCQKPKKSNFYKVLFE